MPSDSRIKNNFKGIIDTTLREGEQFVYGNFSPAERMSIFKILREVGVDRIELGNPLVPEIRKDIGNLSKAFSFSHILVHVRNRLEDVCRAISLNVKGVNILCTIDQKRLESMKISFADYLLDLVKVVRLVKRKKLESRVSGVATPWEVTKDIRQINKQIKAEIEVHFHHDTGCAVANALVALRADANWVDTTLLGIGERTGITPLSTFLLRLHTIDSKLTQRYRLNRLTQADNKMAKILGIKVPFNLVTNKKTGFSYKAGVHINALVNNGPGAYEPVLPRIVGNHREVITGSRISGKTTISQVNSFYKKFGRD